MSRDRSFDTAITLALIAHGLGFLILGLVQRGPVEVQAAALRQFDVGVWSLELEDEPLPESAPDPRSPDTTAQRVASVDYARQHARQSNRRSEPKSVASPSSPSDSAAVAATAPTSNDPQTNNGNATADESRTTNDRAVVATAPTSNVPAILAPSAGDWTAANQVQSPSRPSNHRALTREQLGLGEGNFAALVPQESPVKAEMRARLEPGQRLERSIRQDAAQRSGTLGLGPEGPILAKLEELVLRNMGNLSGSATVSARLFANGSIELQLLGASNDDAAWQRLLARAKQELAAQHLKVSGASRGIDLEIRVASRVQLPSGADPGFGVKLFGIPLKKGEGKRSPGLEVLSSIPSVKCDEEEKDPSLRCHLEASLLKLPLDPTDLSGKRNRVVSARVTKRTVL